VNDRFSKGELIYMRPVKGIAREIKKNQNAIDPYRGRRRAVPVWKKQTTYA